MNLLYIILFVLAASIILTIVFKIYEQFKLRKRIKTLWDAREAFNHSPVSYEKYHNYFVNQVTHEDTEDRFIVDDVTWNDLSLDELFTRIDYCFTTIGQEMLYASLRNSNHNCIIDEEVTGQFKNNRSYREQVSFQLAQLSKSRNSNTSRFIYHFKPTSKFHPIYILTSLLPIISVFLFLLNPLFALIILIIGLTVNVSTAYKHKNDTSSEYDDIFYSMMILNYAGKINPDLKHKKLQKLSFLGPLFINEDQVGELNMSVKLFIGLKSLFMVDYHLYHLIIKSLNNHNTLFRECWYYIATLDVNYSVALWRETLETYALPEEDSENILQTKGLYHPLLKHPIANDFNYQHDILITGSNAAGKSTFMKSIALNIILANGLNTTTSEYFKYRKGKVISSMDISDDILEGDSYFINEVKSLKRIVEEFETFDGAVYCIIDEIFKGTNTIERISAAESFLEYLNDTQNVIVLAATHDLELTELLKESFEFYHFSEEIADDEIYFDYILKPGVATTTNAIELLRLHGFPEEVYRKAKEKAES